jgi:Domain of unknown function (DUF4279)
MTNNALAHASLTITGEQVSPDFWTSYFDVEPDIALVKGAPIKGPSGKGFVQRRLGVWGVDSESAIHSDLLEPHLRFLIKRLGLPRPGLRALVEQTGAKMRFFCFWVNQTGDRIPDVPDDIRVMMESLGGVIEIDEYK